jgi:hypothetical protein
MPSAVESTAKSLVLERSSLYAEFMSGITVSASLFDWVRVLFTDRVKKSKRRQIDRRPYLKEQATQRLERQSACKSFYL